MEIIAGTTDFYLEKDTAVAIGKFDGVHLGHRRLLEEILNKKKNGLAACVFTFDPTPAVLFGLSDGKELTTREEKRRLFEHLGIDILIEFPLTKETAATEPERFVTEILAKQMNTRFVAAGEDLSFGKNGAGNAELLEKMAPQSVPLTSASWWKRAGWKKRKRCWGCPILSWDAWNMAIISGILWAFPQ